MSIIDDLNKINNIKHEIRAAIRDKGIDIPDYAPFAEYPNYIRNISGGGNNGGNGDGGDNGGNNKPVEGSGLIRFKAVGEMPQKDPVIRVNEREYTSNQLFYVDDIYGLDVGEPITQIRFYQNSNISEIIELDVSNITNMGDIFNGCTSLRHVNISNWVTPNVREANGMFYNCTGLEVVDISNWDTSGMKHCAPFMGCNNLHTIRMDNCSYATINMITSTGDFPTSNTTTCTIYCKRANAEGINLPKPWVFSYVDEEPEVPEEPSIPLYVVGEFKEDDMAYEEGTIPRKTEVKTMVNESHNDLSYMFNMCTELRSVNTQDWDTHNVTDMSSMFNCCYSLQSLDASNWDVSNVTTVNSMFSNCTSLQKVDLRNWSLDSIDINDNDWYGVSGVNGMLGNCPSLRELRLDNCNNRTIDLIINSGSFPAEDTGELKRIFCKRSETEDMGLWAPNGWQFVFVVDENEPCYYCGEVGCKGICRAEGGEEDTEYINSGQPYIDVILDSDYAYNIVGQETRTAWQISYDNGNSWHNADVLNESLGQTGIYLRPNTYNYNQVQLYRLFEDADQLVNVNFWNFDFSAESFREESNICPYIDNMFNGCSELQSLDLSAWHTDNVYNMENMFANCTSLETLDIRNWSISSLNELPTCLDGFLANCTNLRILRLDNCDFQTIENIINSSGFPTNAINGVTRIIYCRSEEANDIVAPENWRFMYI